MIDKKTLQQMLEFLEHAWDGEPTYPTERDEICKSLRAALAEPDRVPLTDEQIDEIHVTVSDEYERKRKKYELRMFARAVEAATE
jgi:hypothetical protein